MTNPLLVPLVRSVSTRHVRSEGDPGQRPGAVLRTALRRVGSALAVVAVAALTGCGDGDGSAGNADEQPTAEAAISACKEELEHAGVYGELDQIQSAVPTHDDRFYACQDGDDWTVTGAFTTGPRFYRVAHELMCPLTYDTDGWLLTAPMTYDGDPIT